MAWYSRKAKAPQPVDTTVRLRQAVALLLVAVAAARSWHALGVHDQQLLAAWACTAILFPAWKLAHSRSYEQSTWRPKVETTLRLFSTASPAAVSMSVLNAGSRMAQVDRLTNASLLIASVFAAKGGFWGGMHGLAYSRPWWQQPGAHLGIWWARRKAQRSAAKSKAI